MNYLDELLAEDEKGDMFKTAKFKVSPTERKIIALALSRFEINAQGQDVPLEAKLYPEDLKKVVSDTEHIHRDLAKAAASLVEHFIILDDGMGNNRKISIVTDCSYQKGYLS